MKPSHSPCACSVPLVAIPILSLFPQPMRVLATGYFENAIDWMAIAHLAGYNGLWPTLAFVAFPVMMFRSCEVYTSM